MTRKKKRRTVMRATPSQLLAFADEVERHTEPMIVNERAFIADALRELAVYRQAKLPTRQRQAIRLLAGDNTDRRWSDLGPRPKKGGKR